MNSANFSKFLNQTFFETWYFEELNEKIIMEKFRHPVQSSFQDNFKYPI